MHLHKKFITPIFGVEHMCDEVIVKFWKSFRSGVWIRTPDPDRGRI